MKSKDTIFNRVGINWVSRFDVKKRLITIFLLIILIVTPFFAFSQEFCPYLDSYKAQNNKHRFNSIGEEGDKIIQIDSLTYHTFLGGHYFFLDSNKCEPYTGKVTKYFSDNRYLTFSLLDGREIGLSKLYSRYGKLETFIYTLDTIYLIRNSTFFGLSYFDSQTKKYSSINLYYKNSRFKMKILYDMGGERKKEKITFKNRQELENYFLDNKYYKLLKSLYFFDDFPTEVYLDEK